ncbi:MAG: hypothetical protein ACI9DC_004137 [Gammaproteobacteria bacterium]|jgi:hypothetical protein
MSIHTLGIRKRSRTATALRFGFSLRKLTAHVGAHKLLQAEVLAAFRVNPNAHHREFWLKDPDGYVVVVAGPNEAP